MSQIRVKDLKLSDIGKKVVVETYHTSVTGQLQGIEATIEADEQLLSGEMLSYNRVTLVVGGVGVWCSLADTVTFN